MAQEQPGATGGGSAASTSLAELAERELQELVKNEGSLRSREELMLRNVSRYWARYEVPSSGYGFAQLLGTTERIADRVAVGVYRGLAEMSRRAGSSVIRSEDVEAIVARWLPRQANDFDELVFFPAASEDLQIAVEEIDLEAFELTGFGWQIMGHLSQDKALSDPAAVPLEPAAAARLSEALSAYGLLVLRVGGELAAGTYARFVQSPHLREAAKNLAARAAAKGGGPQSSSTESVANTVFTEVAADSGIDFRHVTSDWLARHRRYGPLAPTFSGGGVAVGDLDEDQWPDLIYCGGRGCGVFANQRDSTFEEITDSTGLRVAGEARMPLLVDFDNDGIRDVFITYARDTNRLFRGLGQGRFEDITQGSGLEGEGIISGPAVAFDYDGDGLLDIYVGNFGNYLAGEDPWRVGNAQNGMPNQLFRNLGDNRFRDVTGQAGGGDTGWTQALSHVDFDLDGDQDIYIANDFGRNDLLVNNGDGTFTSFGKETGADDPYHGMNAAFADLNRDYYPDILITNIWSWNAAVNSVIETNSLLLSTLGPDGAIRYEPYQDPTFLRIDTGWSWGALFLDFDNDADDDLYIVNGATDYFYFKAFRPNPQLPEQLYPINHRRESNVLLRNTGQLPFEAVEQSGVVMSDFNSRGIAIVDYDRDGDVDIALSTFHAEAKLLRNNGAPPGRHWLGVELLGDPARGTSLDAIGAQVIARDQNGLYVWRMRTGGEGYLGFSEPTLHFGLGDSTEVDLEVVWPGNQRQSVSGVQANQRILLRQGIEGFEVLDR